MFGTARLMHVGLCFNSATYVQRLRSVAGCIAGGLNITKNIGAWSQVANMLYIESPAGVGLSVAAHSEDLVTNDTQTAMDTNIFLRKWFRKYEVFQKHVFYISGL